MKMLQSQGDPYPRDFELTWLVEWQIVVASLTLGRAFLPLAPVHISASVSVPHQLSVEATMNFPLADTPSWI